MATLPSVSPEGIRAPLLSDNVGSNAFGVGLAESVGQTGNLLAQIEADKKREAVGANVTEAYTTYLNGAFSVLRDPETGVLNRQLKDASGITEEAVRRLDKMSGLVAAGLKSPVEKRIFGEMVARNRSSERNVIAGHEANETDKYRDATAASMIEAATQIGTQAPMDGQLHADNSDHIRSAVALRLSGKAKPEQVATAQKAAVSFYFASVIAAIPDDQIQQAEALIKAHRDDLLPVDRKKIEDSIAQQNIRDQAQAKADSIYAAAKGDEGAALAEAGKIANERVRVETEQKIRQRAQDDHNARVAAENTDLDAAREVFLRRGSLGAIPRALYDRVAKANPSALLALQNEANSRGKQQPEPDNRAIGEWLELPPEEMAKAENAPWIKLAGRASDNDIQRYSEYRGQILNQQRGLTRLGADVKKPPVMNETVESRIVAYGQRLKLRPEDKGALDIYVWKKIREYQSLNESKNPDQATLDRIMDEAILEGDVKRGRGVFDYLLPDTKLRAFKVTDENFTPGTLPNQPPYGIPPAELAQINKTIQSKGLPATDEQRRKMYEWAHRLDGVAP